ncbi:hypothetical protein NL676_020026 [Syzygium grande]|nr:hypothetical protein NL676_020026 [Syzygium grande]
MDSSLKKTPVLFYLGTFSGETTHGFLNPITGRLDVVQIPELECQVDCLTSKHGWLLLSSRETSSIFLFNPITRDRIDLPRRNQLISAGTFTAAPTSSNCTIFIVSTPIHPLDNRVIIDTFTVRGVEARTSLAKPSTTIPFELRKIPTIELGLSLSIHEQSMFNFTELPIGGI